MKIVTVCDIILRGGGRRRGSGSNVTSHILKNIKNIFSNSSKNDAAQVVLCGLYIIVHQQIETM